MALIRKESGEVQFKVVYCGPPRGGKTTNLQYIHRRLDPRWRGDMISVETEQNRTISFDFLPINSTKIAGHEVKFQLYTVPGQRVMRETRRSVLAGADAVVFVADSDPVRREANVEALEDCFQCLEENRISPKSIPFIFQFNKRDIPGAIPPQELDEMLKVSKASFLASAASGYQVFATLDYVTRMILKGFSGETVRREGHPAALAAKRTSSERITATQG
ncbi:MAG: GTPase domain-containing protein [Verrucomicrobiales bacterium]|nr:GTPase domain-containing protein [Verrucomicrobiales bacterium]